MYLPGLSISSGMYLPGLTLTSSYSLVTSLSVGEDTEVSDSYLWFGMEIETDSETDTETETDSYLWFATKTHRQIRPSMNNSLIPISLPTKSLYL